MQSAGLPPPPDSLGPAPAPPDAAKAQAPAQTAVNRTDQKVDKADVIDTLVKELEELWSQSRDSLEGRASTDTSNVTTVEVEQRQLDNFTALVATKGNLPAPPKQNADAKPRFEPKPPSTPSPQAQKRAAEPRKNPGIEITGEEAAKLAREFEEAEGMTEVDADQPPAKLEDLQQELEDINQSLSHIQDKNAPDYTRLVKTRDEVEAQIQQLTGQSPQATDAPKKRKFEALTTTISGAASTFKNNLIAGAKRIASPATKAIKKANEHFAAKRQKREESLSESASDAFTSSGSSDRLSEGTDTSSTTSLSERTASTDTVTTDSSKRSSRTFGPLSDAANRLRTMAGNVTSATTTPLSAASRAAATTQTAPVDPEVLRKEISELKQVISLAQKNIDKIQKEIDDGVDRDPPMTKEETNRLNRALEVNKGFLKQKASDLKPLEKKYYSLVADKLKEPLSTKVEVSSEFEAISPPEGHDKRQEALFMALNEALLQAHKEIRNMENFHQVVLFLDSQKDISPGEKATLLEAAQNIQANVAEMSQELRVIEQQLREETLKNPPDDNKINELAKKAALIMVSAQRANNTYSEYIPRAVEGAQLIGRLPRETEAKYQAAIKQEYAKKGIELTEEQERQIDAKGIIGTHINVPQRRMTQVPLLVREIVKQLPEEMAKDVMAEQSRYTNATRY